jgi:hypothetical protein
MALTSNLGTRRQRQKPWKWHLGVNQQHGKDDQRGNRQQTTPAKSISNNQ